MPICEGEITQEYFQGLCQFLNGLSLTPDEALVIFEVYKSRRSHVGVDLISRKVQSNNKTSTDVESMVKSLVRPERGFLEMYTSKKEVLCCNCSRYGKQVALTIEERCYSTVLPSFDEWDDKFSTSSKRPFSNPGEWYIPRTFEVWNQSMNPLNIKLLNMRASDEVSQKVMGKIIYKGLAELEITCMVCKSVILKEITFDEKTFWGFEFKAVCDNCKEVYSIMKDMRSLTHKQ